MDKVFLKVEFGYFQVFYAFNDSRVDLIVKKRIKIIFLR